MNDAAHQPTEPLPNPAAIATGPAETQPDSGQTLLEIGQASIYADLVLVVTLLEQAPTAAGGATSQAETRRVSMPQGGFGGRRYEIKGELGRGGMGIVMRALDRDLQREVALKITRGDQSGPHAIARFVSEAQVTGQLSHPNIVPVHELGHESGGRTWFAMKLVEGRSMAAVIAALRGCDECTRADYPLARRLYVFGQLLNAMAYAHDRGVIHRDLKPDNIMLGDYGEVLVMDWGLAKVRGGAELAGKVTTSRLGTPGSETLDGTIVGTPAYMPPEQARGEAENITLRSDIYSLGAILYELLCLRPPYEAATASELLVKVTTQPPPPPGKHNPDVVITRGLEDICMRCLAQDPADRFASVQDLQKALQAHASRLEEAASEGTGFALLGKFYLLTLATALFLLTAWVASGPERMSFRTHLVNPGVFSAFMTLGFGVLLVWLRLRPCWAFDATHAVLFWKTSGVEGDGLRGFFATEACRRAKWMFVYPCLGALVYALVARTNDALVVTSQMFGAGMLCAMAIGVVEQGSYRRLDAMHEVAAQDRRDLWYRLGLAIDVIVLGGLHMHLAGWDFHVRTLQENYPRGILVLHLVAVLAGVYALALIAHPMRDVHFALRKLLICRISPEQRAEIAPMARMLATNALLFGAVGSLTWIGLHSPTLRQPGGAQAVHFAMALTCLWAGILWSWWFRFRARVVSVRKPHETQMQQRFVEYLKTRKPRTKGFRVYIALWTPLVLGAVASMAFLLWRAFLSQA